MVTTILIISIPITALVVGFLVLKSVHMGLRWQYELKQEKPPTFDVPNPIAPIVEVVQEKQQVKHQEEVKSVFNEWVNGAEER